jgi:dihydroflavonol-4-reductase
MNELHSFDGEASNSVSKVLVTGGSGFIGRHLVAELCARGGHVRIIDVAEPDGLPGGVDIHRGSILDPAALRKAMAGVHRVYHLAGIAHLWVRKKSDFALVNGGGTDLVLRTAMEQGIERVVHCSTESVLLPKSPLEGTPIDESRWPACEEMPGPYTRSKHVAEEAALRAAGKGLEVVVVSPTVPIGPDDRNMTPPTAMLAMFLAGRSPFFLDCMLNLVDVRDVAAGVVLAGEKGRSGERYILGGENIALRELITLLERTSGRRMPKYALPASVAFAVAAVAEWTADWVTGRRPVVTKEGVRLALRSASFESRKARHELGYTPRSIENSLADAVRWLCASAPFS